MPYAKLNKLCPIYALSRICHIYGKVKIPSNGESLALSQFEYRSSFITETPELNMELYACVPQEPN